MEEDHKLIVIKSLVPVGTCKKVKLIIREKIERRNSTASFDIIYNPEFYDRDDSYISLSKFIKVLKLRLVAFIQLCKTADFI